MNEYKEALEIVAAFVFEQTGTDNNFIPEVSQKDYEKLLQTDTIIIYLQSSYLIRELAKIILSKEKQPCNTKTH